MADPNSTPAGPDLTDGVPLDQLADGTPLLGHVGDDAVVLVRRGEQLYAIGATCTHYGGPLAEGLVTGESIHCPWHLACFSLRTGEAVGAPALNPVACWHVESMDGRAVVRQKHELAPLADLGRTAPAPPASVVIVGAGAAGSAAAEMLRRQGYAGPITMIDPDVPAPYDRPNLSKDYLAGNAPEEWIPLRPDGFYAEHGIERIAAEVTSLDTQHRALTLSDGRTREYGALLLATGAEPNRLRTPGAELDHVHLLRTFADCKAIIARAEKSRRVAVIGASFIGMEAAASLRTRGLEVAVIAPDSLPFEKTLGAELGRRIQRAHEAHGVRFHLGRTAAEITPDRLRLDDGTEVEADLVVVGVGVKPRVALAEAAGIAVENGVMVDEFLESSAPGVFAAGDIARWPDPHTGERIRVEHWIVAQRQGQAAAKNILGLRVPFTEVPFFWTHQFDVPVSYTGHATRWDRIEIDGDLDALDAAVAYLAGDQRLALATINRNLEGLEAEARMG
jgi:3-phenylpropionate/trans-cinnamate dioxygenase ferredoxin reductase subunit